MNSAYNTSAIYTSNEKKLMIVSKVQNVKAVHRNEEQLSRPLLIKGCLHNFSSKMEKDGEKYEMQKERQHQCFSVDLLGRATRRW